MPVAYTYSISTYVYTTVSYGYMTYTTVPALQNEPFQCKKLDFPIGVQRGEGRWAFTPCSGSLPSGGPNGRMEVTPLTTWQDVSNLHLQHGLRLTQHEMHNDCILPVGLVHTRQVTPKGRRWNQLMRNSARLVYVRGMVTDGGVIAALEFRAFCHNENGDLIDSSDFMYRREPLAMCTINNLRKIQFEEKYYDEKPDGSTDWHTPLERVLCRLASDYMYKFSPRGALEVLGDWFTDRTKTT